MKPANHDLWVFGYGSLIWRADFPFIEKRAAYIKGWSRRFWQGSTDHRGVPGAPGRVVTLVRSPGQSCWGAVYRLAPDVIEETLVQLDHRERGGYARLQLPVWFDDRTSVEGFTYHATADNCNYLGEASDEQIARQVVNSAGPSGHNIEYVLELANSLREIHVQDIHVSAVATWVRRLVAETAD